MRGRRVALTLARRTMRTSARCDVASGQVDPAERAKFERDASSWWRERDGPFAALHSMNPARVAFVRDGVRAQFGLDDVGARALVGTRILDVGCGGGILAEALARLGADVTGIDAGAANVEIARAHASGDDALRGRLRYEATTAEALGARGETFDCVTSLEVIEHVSDPLAFVETLGKLVRPGGALFISTINRTVRSFAFAIVGAERVLGVVPPGTHQFSKFLTPGEIAFLVSRAGCEMKELAGLTYDPIRNVWSLSTDTQINFIAHCVKPETTSNAR